MATSYALGLTITRELMDGRLARRIARLERVRAANRRRASLLRRYYRRRRG